MSNKIAFILCVNNDLYFEECNYYINHLTVPENYQVEIIGIHEASSMCAAYNLGMQSTDAKYKVYMHQDVFIKEKRFIEYILSIFQSNSEVGMIGMAGGIGMPKTGVAYLAWNVGGVDCREPDMAYHLVCDPEGKKDRYVDAVDGLLMATQYDIPWREDLFHNFDFYDISQSFEMRRHGYKIIVPYQQTPWVIHDSGFAKLSHYDDNRRICLKEYPEYLTEDDGFAFSYQEEWETLSEELAAQVRGLIHAGNWDEIKNIIQAYRKNQMKNSMLEMYGIMSDIYQKEKQVHIEAGFFYGLSGYEEIYRKYITVRFLLRRMETGMPESEYIELLEALKVGIVSCEAIIIMVLHSVLDKKVVLSKIEDCYRREGQIPSAEKIHAFYEKIKDKELPTALSKRAKPKTVISRTDRNEEMILKNENSIYIFYEVIRQLEPTSILDMGMFLKRVGSVSRKIMDREVPKEVVLDGVDFFPEVSFPIWDTIYDRIETAEEYFDRMEEKRYDLVTVFGMEEMKKKIPLADIAERTAKTSKYVLVDQWLPEWSTQKAFVRAVDIKVEDDIYFLMEFGA